MQNIIFTIRLRTKIHAELQAHFHASFTPDCILYKIDGNCVHITLKIDCIIQNITLQDSLVVFIVQNEAVALIEKIQTPQIIQKNKTLNIYMPYFLLFQIYVFNFFWFFSFLMFLDSYIFNIFLLFYRFSDLPTDYGQKI